MRWIRPLIAALGIVMVGSSCASRPAEVQLSVEWESYRDVSDLAASADLTVEATALSSVSQMTWPEYVPADDPEEDPFYGTGMSEEEIADQLAQQDGLPATYVTLSVDRVFSGSAEVGSEITVVQMGGLIDGTRYWVDGIPLMDPGESYLLFAQHDLGGNYAVLGGSAGLFEATAG